MAGGWTIDTPYELTQLPHTFTAEGKTFAGEIFTIAGSKKKKRPEIAIAVDGVGVNIYNVQIPGFVTSYAVSPQDFFTCPPCCFRLKNEKAESLRSTFCSISSGASSRITGFFERGTKTDQHDISTLSFKLDSKSDVVHLGVLPSLPSDNKDEENLPDILAIQRDGHICRLSGSLDEQRWNIDLASLVEDEDLQPVLKDSQVELASTFDAAIARKGILRYRSDLNALMSTEKRDEYSQMLLLVSRPRNDPSTFIFHLFYLPAPTFRTTGLFTGRASYQLQHLISTKLPQSSRLDDPDTRFEFSFHAQSGMLYKYCDKGITAFNLSGFSPDITSEMRFRKQDSATYLRLSQSTVLVSSRYSIAACNIEYNAVQNSIDTRGVFPLSKSDLLAGRRPHLAIRLLSYYTKTNLVVAQKNNKLLGIQITTSGSRKRKAEGTLIESIGRGMYPLGSLSIPENQSQSVFSQTICPSAQDVQAWEEAKKSLDECVRKRDIHTFETTMATHLDLTPEDLNALGKLQLNSGFRSWWPDSHPSFSFAHQPKAKYLLSKIFTLTSNPSTTGSAVTRETHLKIAFFPRRLFIWLIISGNLSETTLQVALRQTSPLYTNTILLPGSIVTALVAFEYSFLMLRFYLFYSHHLTTSELAVAIKLLVQNQSASAAKKVLPTNAPDSRVREVIDEDKSTSDVASGKNSPSLHSSITGNPNILPTLSLNAAFDKLSKNPEAQIVAKLREHLSRDELFTLITLLQPRLVSAAWTPEYIDDLSSELDDRPRSRQPSLETLSCILTSALSALTLSGLLTTEIGSSIITSSDPTVPSPLRAALSSAIVAAEEALYLRSLFAPLLSYSNSLSRARKLHISVPQKYTKNREGITKPVTETLERELTRGPLPLGGKLNEELLKDKMVGAGGELKEMSVKELGRRKGRLVGIYGVERIEI